MVEIRLSHLLTEFSPGRIVLRIELIPMNGEEFDLPMEEAGNKLSAVANYARATFGVRTSTLPEKSMAVPTQQAWKRPITDMAERRKNEIAKNITKGSDRALQVMQGELDRAIEEGDHGAITRAREHLERSKDMYNKNKAEKDD